MPHDIALTAGIGASVMNIELNDRNFVAANYTVKGYKPAYFSKSYNNMVSPHLALNKVFSRQLSVYASYSVGYKAPTSSYFFIPTTGQLNTNLRSVYVLNEKK